jgi:hypothetical protein
MNDLQNTFWDSKRAVCNLFLFSMRFRQLHTYICNGIGNIFHTTLHIGTIMHYGLEPQISSS